MDWLSYCALWVFSFMVVTVDSTEDFTRRRLHKGWVTGNRHSVLDGIIVHEYLGIPMGKPPIGNRRFRKPEPVDPWMGQYNASKRSNACINFKDVQFGDFWVRCLESRRTQE
ncbi:hypothetical protein EB796_015151 [Bugula neritina]|uniref:Carboxylesterase type B domain-containing protein n=1 Tax=Bugula neritina TaxID=10212 RepID=A0A7J7JLK3_BUGNE|nr:hypothetical protein EB796_015151 [Bugula neritina]